MKAYCNIIDSKVMVSTLPKPDTESYSHILLNKEGVPTNILNSKEYQQAIKAFESSILGEAENAEQVHDEYYVWIEDKYLMKHNPHKLHPNQPCEVEGLTIKKLL